MSFEYYGFVVALVCGVFHEFVFVLRLNRHACENSTSIFLTRTSSTYGWLKRLNIMFKGTCSGRRFIMLLVPLAPNDNDKPGSNPVGGWLQQGQYHTAQDGFSERNRLRGVRERDVKMRGSICFACG